ncbi:MAG: cob(I)yrinic acid a,c-diamide adenosyltransferase [Bryobacterales bacterium]|nr:cob(I)yrinic acid a,c-diamide adenosyltransferase [Bryobacterales bacterium]
MAEPKTFNEPRLRISKIYTKSGDKGMTSLVNGRRVAKNHARIDTYGTVDELNANLGLAAASIAELEAGAPGLERLGGIVSRVQHELFNLGSLLATDPAHLHPKQPRITEADVSMLEAEIDSMNEDLPELTSFVLPGGCRLNAELHVSRTVCRRAERLCYALSQEEEVPAEVLHYLNRLSDALFVWSRWASKMLGVPEVLWNPNRSAGANAG